MKNKEVKTTRRKPGAQPSNTNSVKSGHFTKTAIQERQEVKNMLQDMEKLLRTIKKENL
jgi:hypothetical protein